MLTIGVTVQAYKTTMKHTHIHGVTTMYCPAHQHKLVQTLTSVESPVLG